MLGLFHPRLWQEAILTTAQSLISIYAHIGSYSRRGDRIVPRPNEFCNLVVKRDCNDRRATITNELFPFLSF